MMAVSAANADIASTDYVGKQITATAGTLTSLKTTAKGNLVAAINEVDDNIGTVSFTAEGSTQGKTNLTEAIAAVDAFVQGMSNVQAGITTSINELDGAIETLNGDAQTAGSVLKSINDHAVNSVTSGTTNGTIKVDGAEVAVAGLGSAAYTESSAYATSAQGTKADNALARTQIGAAANFTIPDECKAENAVCSLVVRKGVAGWEKVTY